VGSRPKGVRSGISDGGAGLSRALLELAQRLGIDSDVEPHLRRSGRLVNRKCLGFVKKLVQLGGRDLVVVRHAYILPLPVALVAANLSSARLPRRAHVPRVRVNRVRVEDDGEHAAAVRRSDHKNRALHTWARVADHYAVTVVDLPNFLGTDRVGSELVDRRLREEQDHDAHRGTVLLRRRSGGPR